MRALREGLVVGLCAAARPPASPHRPRPNNSANNDPYEAINRENPEIQRPDRQVFRHSHCRSLFPAQCLRRAAAGCTISWAICRCPSSSSTTCCRARPSAAPQSLGRIVINSTLGLGGFFDPAAKMGIPGHGEDMGQTLATHGVKEGPIWCCPFSDPAIRATPLAWRPTGPSIPPA